MPPVRTVTATRYVTPLREGGSMPGIVEADDDGLYVLKFRGAGQGTKALAAELVAGEVARALGLPVPELVFVQLDPARHEDRYTARLADVIKRKKKGGTIKAPKAEKEPAPTPDLMAALEQTLAEMKDSKAGAKA